MSPTEKTIIRLLAIAVVLVFCVLLFAVWWVNIDTDDYLSTRVAEAQTMPSSKPNATATWTLTRTPTKVLSPTATWTVTATTVPREADVVFYENWPLVVGQMGGLKVDVRNRGPDASQVRLEIVGAGKFDILSAVAVGEGRVVETLEEYDRFMGAATFDFGPLEAGEERSYRVSCRAEKKGYYEVTVYVYLDEDAVRGSKFDGRVLE
jgi:hypothetical protein